MRRFLLTLGVLLYALLFAETFLRLADPQALVPRYVTAGPEGVRANLPNADFRQWTPEVDVRIRYNAAGMRDDRPAPPIAKPKGECRVALLGDSYFVGFESDWSHSFAAQLEAELKARNHPCRVLNFAVSGFGHAEALAILHSRVRPYQPDWIIISVHQTDGLDNLRANLWKPAQQGLQPTGKTYLPGTAISDQLNRFAAYRWLQENSHLYSAIREWAGRTGKALLATIRGKQAASESEEEPTPPAENTTPTWTGNQALNRAIIQQLERESAAIGAQTILFEIPANSGRKSYRPVATTLLGPDIPVTSPAAHFNAIASPDTQLYLERGHRHWTPLGNHEAAKIAADALVGRFSAEVRE